MWARAGSPPSCQLTALPPSDGAGVSPPAFSMPPSPATLLLLLAVPAARSGCRSMASLCSARSAPSGLTTGDGDDTYPMLPYSSPATMSTTAATGPRLPPPPPLPLALLPRPLLLPLLLPPSLLAIPPPPAAQAGQPPQSVPPGA